MFRAIFAPASCVLFGVGLTLVLPTWAAWITVPYSLFFLADMGLRYRDYKRLLRRGYVNFAIIKRQRYSFCQRQVCIAAELQDGTGWSLSQAAYKQWGYRWYHILPDGFPSCLTRKRWWKSFLKG